MINDVLFQKLSALTLEELTAVRRSALEPLIDAQKRFALGMISERELLAITLSVNENVGQMPTAPGMTREVVKLQVGGFVEETELAIRERLLEL